MTKEEAIINLKTIKAGFVNVNTKEQLKIVNDTFNMAIEALKQGVYGYRITGKWKPKKDGRYIYAECSECGKIHDVAYNYCPSCGCIMDLNEFITYIKLRE